MLDIQNGMVMALPHLREWRLNRRMTQQQLARAAGVIPMTISRLELGIKRARVSTALRIAAALDVTLEQLSSAPKPDQAA